MIVSKHFKYDFLNDSEVPRESNLQPVSRSTCSSVPHKSASGRQASGIVKMLRRGSPRRRYSSYVTHDDGGTLVMYLLVFFCEKKKGGLWSKYPKY